jgi:23S rRNA (uridine2552-2'-O)-methyltransferase
MHRRDYYYKKAKEEKYRSRAAYKLQQSIRKYRFMKPRDTVVDLGAAPGGWTQVASKTIGEQGIVLGIDLKEIEPFTEPNACSIVGDITKPETIEQIKEILPKPADVVISDASQNLSGAWELDHARQIDLARQALQIALGVLRASGNFFVKIFQGDMTEDFVAEVKRHFDRVEIVKPKASRMRSAEIYILGLRLKARLP